MEKSSIHESKVRGGKGPRGLIFRVFGKPSLRRRVCRFTRFNEDGSLRVTCVTYLCRSYFPFRKVSTVPQIVPLSLRRFLPLVTKTEKERKQIKRQGKSVIPSPSVSISSHIVVIDI